MAHGNLIVAKYWNTNGMQVSIVAVQGGTNDVAAYIGATANAHHEQETHDWTILHGAKLYRDEAFRMLPRLEQILEDTGMHYRD